MRFGQKTGRILMVGHLLEYHPAVEAMKSLIHKGSWVRLIIFIRTD